MPLPSPESSPASSYDDIPAYGAAILRQIRRLGPQERELLSLLQEIYARRDALFAKLDGLYHLQSQMHEGEAAMEERVLGRNERGDPLSRPHATSTADAPSNVSPRSPSLSSNTLEQYSASVGSYDPDEDEGDDGEGEGSRSSTPTQSSVSSMFLRLRLQDTHFEVVTGPRIGHLETLIDDSEFDVDGQHDEYEYEEELAERHSQEEEYEGAMSPSLEQATDPSIWDSHSRNNSASWGDPDDDETEDSGDVASIVEWEIDIRTQGNNVV